MTEPLAIVIITLFCLLLAGSPVIFAIGCAGLIYFIVKPGMWAVLSVYPHKFFTGMDSFVFLCIPLFLIAGEVMGRTGMSDRVVRFAQLIVGRFRGGLAYVNVLANMLFGGISGSALADISALGPVIINLMKSDGYTGKFSTALTVSSAIQGPIIPPSIPMVIFASLTNTSVGALFLGGAIPGVMIGLSQMAVVRLKANKSQFPKRKIEGLNSRMAAKIVMEAFWALMMPVIILGGMISGVFTATEAAAVAVFYSLLVGGLIYRELTFKKMWAILDSAVRTTATIYLIIAFTSIVSWVLASERVPDIINRFVQTYHFSPAVFLLLANLFFLFNGCWISDTVQLLLFAPLFTPIFERMGVHPIHFGVIMVVNVMIGLLTPPYGTALYLGSAVGKEKLSDLVPECMPFILASILILFLITYIPSLVLWLPTKMGLILR